MNSDELIKSKIFTRRALIISFIKFLFLFGLISRLAYLQIVKRDQYKLLSDKNSVRAIITTAIRGVITDRFGTILANNKHNYSAMISTNYDKNFSITLQKLLDMIEISQEDKEKIYQRLSKQRSSRSMLVYSPLSWDEVVNIEVNSNNLPGIFIQTGYTRFYPFKDICSNIIGYTGNPNEDEINEYPFFKNQDAKIGKTGVEKYFNQELIGEFGIKRFEVNAHGNFIKELSKENPVNGKELKLSIDIALQHYVDSLFKNKVASAVVMNVKTGEILSMNSSPGYNPNMFVQGMDAKKWKEIIKSPSNPMINKAIANHYPPGSIFKLITVAASLEAKVPHNTIYNCCGYVMVGERKFHCWKKDGHGNLNMVKALLHSCNCYMFNLVKKIGIDKIQETAKLFGLGSITDIELPGEISGLIPDRRWKIKRFKKNWHIGDSLNSSIGQGFILSTPLQLAQLAARIATGKNIKPTIILDGNKNKIFEYMNFSEENFQVLRNSMFKVVNDVSGSAYLSRIEDLDFFMAGKTGTSQVISKKNENEDLSSINTAWHNKNHGLFIGYAPYDNPKYALSVIVEHGGSGASSAAPIAKSIMLEIKKLYQND